MSTRRIVILGFMALGKNTRPKKGATRIHCRRGGFGFLLNPPGERTPAEIIMQDGEDAFREVETLALRDVLQDREAHVIALGGGTWNTPANRTLIALHDCLTVWLDEIGR